MDKISKITNTFEGIDVTTYFCRGRACWIAKDIGRLMGYSKDGRRLSSKVTDEWSNEFIEDTDYCVISGDELADFKSILRLDPESGSSRFPSLMLLFESGLHLALAKTNKPVGIRLRRFIADEVMPQVFRDGSYLPERTVEQGRIVESEESVELRKLRLAEAREARLDRQYKERVLTSLVKRIRKSGRVADDILDSYDVCAAEDGLGRDLSNLKPRTEKDDWKSPTEIAVMYGTSAQMVGRVVSDLGFRGNIDGICRAIVNKAKGHQRTVTSYLYSPAAVEAIGKELAKRGVIEVEDTEDDDVGGILN